MNFQGLEVHYMQWFQLGTKLAWLCQEEATVRVIDCDALGQAEHYLWYVWLSYQGHSGKQQVRQKI